MMTVTGESQPPQSWVSDMKLEDWGFDKDSCVRCGIQTDQIDNLLMQCALCKRAYYCSMKCFNDDLPAHQKICRTAPLIKEPERRSIGTMIACTNKTEKLIISSKTDWQNNDESNTESGQKLAATDSETATPIVANTVTAILPSLPVMDRSKGTVTAPVFPEYCTMYMQAASVASTAAAAAASSTSGSSVASIASIFGVDDNEIEESNVDENSIVSELDGRSIHVSFIDNDINYDVIGHMSDVTYDGRLLGDDTEGSVEEILFPWEVRDQDIPSDVCKWDGYRFCKDMDRIKGNTNQSDL